MSRTTPASRDKKKSFQRKLQRLRSQVEKEIKEHKKWCDKNCRPAPEGTFLPSEYRRMRLVEGLNAKDVQGNYDTCHKWR